MLENHTCVCKSQKTVVWFLWMWVWMWMFCFANTIKEEKKSGHKQSDEMAVIDCSSFCRSDTKFSV